MRTSSELGDFGFGRRLSVIMPLAPMEEDVTPVLRALNVLGGVAEVVVASSNTDHKCFVDEMQTATQSALNDLPVHFVKAPSGRACCLNEGARHAKGEHLFFLHADSVFAEKSLVALIAAIKRHPEALLYFDLAFSKGSHPLMKLNEWGAFFRCRILKTPFGDQGLCISKDVFEKLGGYPENVSCGEDHQLVRKARSLGIPILPVKAPLYTSARKYEKNGWLKTTLNHLYLWRKQAGEEL